MDTFTLITVLQIIHQLLSFNDSFLQKNAKCVTIPDHFALNQEPSISPSEEGACVCARYLRLAAASLPGVFCLMAC